MKLEVIRKRDSLIFETPLDSDKQGIQAGSKIFCGFCGQEVGETKIHLVFPFRWDLFVDTLMYRQLSGDPQIGLTCHMCNAIHFKPFISERQMGTVMVQGLSIPQWNFISVELFKIEQAQYEEVINDVLSQVNFDEDD